MPRYFDLFERNHCETELILNEIFQFTFYEIEQQLLLLRTLDLRKYSQFKTHFKENYKKIFSKLLKIAAKVGENNLKILNNYDYSRSCLLFDTFSFPKMPEDYVQTVNAFQGRCNDLLIFIKQAVQCRLIEE